MTLFPLTTDQTILKVPAGTGRKLLVTISNLQPLSYIRSMPPFGAVR